MLRDIQTVGECAKCGAEAAVTCRYNHFERPEEELVIDAWEHKCANCGIRETTAYRSDDPEEEHPEDSRKCPYCGRDGTA
ncbi:MAG: hypothetical protein CMJ64_06300 [Planctomycetaceae bacterium]|nr:hypothetical protein [Planctomycetaceae bacterium]